MAIGGNEVGRVVYAIAGDNSQFQSDVNQTESIAGSAGGRIAKIIGGAFAGAVVAAAAALGKLAKTGIEYNSQMEQYSTAFTTLMGGNAEAADGLIGSIRDLAASTPLAMESLAAGAQTLMGYGMASDDVIGTLGMLGDAAMGDADKLNSMVLAYSQVQASGKLMGQDALQMINAGVPIYSLLGKTMGVTAGEAKKMGEEGKISAEMVTEALKAATSEGGMYFGAMEAQSQTLSGKVSTLKDNFNQFAGELSESLMPAAMGIVDTLSEMITGNDDLKETLTTLFEAVANLAIDALPMLVEVLNLAVPLFAELMEGILPLLVDLFNQLLPPLMELASTLFPVIVDLLETLLPPMIEVAEAVLPVLIEALDAVLPLFTQLMDLLGPIIDLFLSLLQPILDIISQAIDPLIAAFQPLVDMLGETLMPLIEALQPLFETVFPIIQTAVELACGAITLVIEALSKVIGSIIEDITTAIGKVNEFNSLDAEGKSEFVYDAANENVKGNTGSKKGGEYTPVTSPSTTGSTRKQVGEDFISADWTPIWADRGERILTAADNVKFNTLGGLQGMESAMGGAYDKGSSAPIHLQVQVKGDAIMDGYTVGKVVMESFDDVVAMTVGGR